MWCLGKMNSLQVLNLRNTEASLTEEIQKLQRDNKRQQSEIAELTQQLSSGGRSVLDLEQAKKRLEVHLKRERERER
jgi:hypothetical protein